MHTYSLRVLLAVWGGLLALGSEDDLLEVQTPSGRIRGVTVEGIGGKTVDAFLGVPYGAPTGGQHRFSPPKEAVPWDGTYDASKFSSPCHQVIPPKYKDVWFVSKQKGSENCLKLNIWVPKSGVLPKAVMVWIHGGAFASGSTDVPLYNGATLAAHEDVIVVSLNYRLSAFGFLYLAHPSAPGNVGLLDQTLGLQWVKKNIGAFGGDPDRVTIFGQSAGGGSAGFHLLSPTSLDLFQNAILHSGALSCEWAISEPEYALKQSLMLIEKAGCPVNENERDEAIRCLQNLDDEKLLEFAKAVEGETIRLAFRPVIDGKHLPDSPDKLLKKGRFCSKKRVMIGYTKEDGSFLISIWAPHLHRMEKFDYTNDDLRKLIASLTYIEDDISGFPLDLISHNYLEWNADTSNYTLSFDSILEFLTDRWFGCPATYTAQEIANKGNTVYFYRFDHEPKMRDESSQAPSWFGVAHADELPFIFGRTLGTKHDPEEVDLSKKLMRYWSNFAKTGDPNENNLPFWPKYTTLNRSWVQIGGKDITVEKVKRQKKCAFWENIFPKIEIPMK